MLDNKDSDDFVKATGDTLSGTHVVQGTLKVNGKFDFPEFFGWKWHDVATAIHGSTIWKTVVDTASSGVLLMIQATGGSWSSSNRVKITIDDSLWREYTGVVNSVGNLGWMIVDDTADDNAGLLTIMPFKAFNTSLKVELYNASATHESAIRVNYLTP